MARIPGRGRTGRSRTGATERRAAADAEPPAEDGKPPDKPEGRQEDKTGVMWLADLIDRAVKHVPYVRYAFGLVGIAAAAALIVAIFRIVANQFFAENSIAGMFVLSAFVIVFMFVLFLFARFEEGNRRFLQTPAKIVAWLSVAIVIGLVCVATSVGLVRYPPHIYDAVFTKLATQEQKMLRDKFKRRAVYAQHCNNLDRESEHAYLETCLLSATKDFFQECSGFTPEADDDQEQEIDDFACLNPRLHNQAGLARPGSVDPVEVRSVVMPSQPSAADGMLLPVQAVSMPCSETLLGRRLNDAKQAFDPNVLGFDISHHNKDVPWDRLIGEGAVFVIMKATEGKGFTDPAFVRNWMEAGKRGLLRGAYHVMRYGQDAGPQIQHFEKTTANVDHRRCDFGPAIDLMSAARGKPVPGRDLVAIAQWHEWSEDRLRQPAILFSNAFFLESQLDMPPDLLERGVLWLQDFNKGEPSPPSGYSRAFIWQFTNGQDGPPPAIDRNRFTGDAAAFVRMLRLEFPD